MQYMFIWTDYSWARSNRAMDMLKVWNEEQKLTENCISCISYAQGCNTIHAHSQGSDTAYPFHSKEEEKLGYFFFLQRSCPYFCFNIPNSLKQLFLVWYWYFMWKGWVNYLEVCSIVIVFYCYSFKRFTIHFLLIHSVVLS